MISKLYIHKRFNVSHCVPGTAKFFIEIEETEKATSSCSRATEQFTIDDKRSPAAISKMLKDKRYESVWDLEILNSAP